MTEVTIELPDQLAEAVEQKAVELGTTTDQLLSLVVTDAIGGSEVHEDLARR